MDSQTLTLQDITQEKLTDNLGSNPGGFYQGADGKKRYVKYYYNPLQANVEHLANKIYGEHAPETHLFPHEDGVAIASEFVPHKKEISLNPDPQTARKVFETGFVPDVMLSNHDVIGLTGDNIVVDDNGNVKRIDNGGSMMFRAQGNLKPDHVLEEIGEWDNFMGMGERKTKYGNLFNIAGYNSPKELLQFFLEQYNRIEAIRNEFGSWLEFVKKNSLNISEDQIQKIANLLETRQNLVKQKINELVEGSGNTVTASSKKKKVYNQFHQDLIDVAKTIKCCGDYGYLYVLGKKVWWVASDSDSDEFAGYDTAKEIINKFKKVKGVTDVIIESEYCPPQKENWERLN